VKHITQGWFEIQALPGEFHQIVSLSKGMISPDQEGLECLLGLAPSFETNG
jgi:hypothetical protein